MVAKDAYYSLVRGLLYSYSRRSVVSAEEQRPRRAFELLSLSRRIHKRTNFFTIPEPCGAQSPPTLARLATDSCKPNTRHITILPSLPSFPRSSHCLLSLLNPKVSCSHVSNKRRKKLFPRNARVRYRPCVVQVQKKGESQQRRRGSYCETDIILHVGAFFFTSEDHSSFASIIPLETRALQIRSPYSYMLKRTPRLLQGSQNI